MSSTEQQPSTTVVQSSQYINIDDYSSDYWYNLCKTYLNAADIQINGTRPHDIRVKNAGLFQRVINEGSLGFGEAYMDNWWECDRVDEMIYRMVRCEVHKNIPMTWGDIFKVLTARFFNLQTQARAWIVGKEHYDLGNDLFERILDPYMQYSCGYWKNATTLEQAQRDKLEMICQKLQLQPGQRLLDIGCGWGGLAKYAAENYQVSVVGLTISAEQQKLAQKNCSGLPVEIKLQDYRDMYDTFDRIVSVGMFEHVGQKNYNIYFDVVKRCLKQDGIFLLHTIGGNIDMSFDPWLNTYIFPNGYLPTVANIADSAQNKLILEDWHNIGPDYDRTLMEWLRNFDNQWPTIQKNGGYDQRFHNMFRYYLQLCAGAFRSRNVQLWQVLFSSRGIDGANGATRVSRL